MSLTPDTSPPHKHEIEVFRPRFGRFLKTVIEPAVHGPGIAAGVSAWQTRDPVTYDAAASREYSPVAPGFRWGPAWSTCWFRLSAILPDPLPPDPIDLRFSTRTEATLWVERDGHANPVRGLDINRDSIDLGRYIDLAPGGNLTLFVEAACNHPFGISTFDWDISDTHDRWRSHDPGHLLYAEIAPRREPVERLATLYRFASALLDELDPRSPEARPLFEALTAATGLIDDRDVNRNAEEAAGRLARALRSSESPHHARSLGLAVAHAHIDTAWLWPIRETRRKIIRSWSNALEVLDTTPAASFICSQAQQYAYLEEDAPILFDRVREHVRRGRWEPIGGMWVEPDANVPSAESLIRQTLLGQRYWRERFPRSDAQDAADQRVLYLPDTFGFPASLPDIMLACGLDTFITNKIAWNQCHAYLHTNFRWAGLGGGHVLAHFTPNHDYNCTNSPKELIRTKANLRPLPEASGGSTQVFLHPYGFGDGGGGPTREQASVISATAPGDGDAPHPALPAIRHGTAREFRELLHTLDRDLASSGSGGLPLHSRELYLELHRGTLTSHAWLKQANRDAEHALRIAEILAFAAPGGLSDGHVDIADDLTAAWRLLCLQQFHDILPGSSIAAVYDDARRDLDRVGAVAGRIKADALPRWTDAADPEAAPGAVPGRGVFNPASSTVSAVVAIGDELSYVRDLAPVSISPVRDAPPPAFVRLEHTGTAAVLENGLVRARIDERGRITSLRATADGAPGPELAAEPLNRLALYRDIPMSWDAWDIDLYAEDELLETNDTPAPAWRVRTAHPLRAEIEITHRIGDRSEITQVIRLDAGSPRLDIDTAYEWDETHRLLRVEFPTTVDATRAAYDIQAGWVERPTTRETPEQRMMFEVCAHRWMDVSEPGAGRGLSVLNTGRYGCGVRRSATPRGARTTMHLSLLRSPMHPDPTAGRDSGKVTCALLPHAGDWRTADADRHADALNNPPVPVECGRDEHWAPISVREAAGQRIDVSAIKPAWDDPSSLVVRLIETRGVAGEVSVDWNLPVRGVIRTDAIERACELPVRHSSGTTTVHVPAHGIVTLLADRG